MECGSRFFFIISDTSLRGSLFPYIIKPSDPFLEIFYSLDFLETLNISNEYSCTADSHLNRI